MELEIKRSALNPLECIVVSPKDTLNVVCSLNVFLFFALEGVSSSVGVDRLSLALVLHHEPINSFLCINQFIVEFVHIVFDTAGLMEDLVSEW